MTRESKMDRILRELEEEKRKRQELESMVQELLSRSSVNQDKQTTPHK